VRSGAWIAEASWRAYRFANRITFRVEATGSAIHTLKILASGAKLTESQMSLVVDHSKDTMRLHQTCRCGLFAQHLAIENVPALASLVEKF